MLKAKSFILIPLCLLICIISCAKVDDPVEKQNEFTFYTVGSGGIKARFGTDIHRALDNLRQNTDHFDEFLFATAEEPLTKDQIREKSGLSRSQVEYFIANLDSCNIIKKIDQNRWATTLPVVTDKMMLVIREDLTPMAKSVAQYLEQEIPQIRTLYDKVKSSLDPPWEDVSHLIISKFIIDGTFHSHFNRIKRESDNRAIDVIPAYMRQKGEYNSNFGCNWYKFSEGDDQREVYVLHGAILDRYNIAVNQYRRDQYFPSCLFNISPEGRIDVLGVREREILENLDWITGDHLMVPIVKAATIKRLWPEMEKIGKDAAAVAHAQFNDMKDSYNRSTHSKFLDHDEDYIQVLVHSLFGLTIEHLVKSGSVSQIPQPVPESFGVYLVFGQLF